MSYYIPYFSAYVWHKATKRPILECLKNSRILKINGFEDSKVSLAIHDIMDHAWGWYLMRETGLSVKHKDLFDSIGDPEHTDIYSREGEIVASICMGVRLWAIQEKGFVPIIDTEDIKTKMSHYFAEGNTVGHQIDAYRILCNIPKSSVEWQTLGFVFSNYVTELDEQRRKHGRIKQKDASSRKIIGELDPFSPEFLSFIIELNHELMKSKNKHRNELFKTHLLLEEFFKAIAEGRIEPNQVFSLLIDRLRSATENPYEFSDCTLDPITIKWMYINYGFTATKEGII